jgi:cell wall-active antibiotic response 4TMS protein YvqF/putative adhesin
MKYHRGLLFWGIALITGGAVALAAQQGYLDQEVLAGTWRLWPLILIAIGTSILLSRTPFAIVGTVVAALVLGAAGGALIAVGPGVAACGGSEPTNLTTERGTFGDAARVSLDFNCGTLVVGANDIGEWSVVSGNAAGHRAKVTAASDRLNVETSQGSQWWGAAGREHWVVALPTGPSYQLEVSPNAADTNIDLSGLRFTSISLSPNAGSLTLDLIGARVDVLDLSLNAGSASVTIGQGSAMDATMSVNGGSIEVCTETGVALQVTVDPNLTFSTNLDESGLTQAGETWSTVGYDDATDRVHIDLEGNAASFTVNPKGGCG